VTLIGRAQPHPAKIEEVLALALRANASSWRRALPRPATFSTSAAGIHFPIALEGALKLKEISYIHAEGYPAGR